MRDAAADPRLELYRSGVGPVSLEERVRFRSELRAGEEIDVSCAFVWGEGKTFRVEQELRRPEGNLVAEVTNVGGLLDLKTRRLVERSRRAMALASRNARGARALTHRPILGFSR